MGGWLPPRERESDAATPPEKSVDSRRSLAAPLKRKAARSNKKRKLPTTNKVYEKNETKSAPEKKKSINTRSKDLIAIKQKKKRNHQPLMIHFDWLKKKTNQMEANRFRFPFQGPLGEGVVGGGWWVVGGLDGKLVD